jgi:ubiquinone/menaquinone biosynthesis C-methylase UbiE
MDSLSTAPWEGIMSTLLYFGLNFARSRVYLWESFLIPVADFVSTKRVPIPPFKNPKFFLMAQRALYQLLLKDAQRIHFGYYPSSVLWKSEPYEGVRSHLSRLPGLFTEAMALARRRKEKITKEVGKEIEGDLPSYFLRNFHFQKDGYLSEESAALYDHQVELLFAGAADPMRRLALAPLKRAFKGSMGKGLRILDLGCGTGTSSRFLSLAFPEAEIVGLDLSKFYLDFAKKANGEFPIEWVQGKGEALPFAKGEFDAVVSVFLFHELPKDIRRAALMEMKRVLRAKGVLAIVDSLQLGDNPDLDYGLLQFPKEFHEPFFPNYIRNPLEKQMRECGLKVGGKELGFFSKVVWSIRDGSPAKKKQA